MLALPGMTRFLTQVGRSLCSPHRTHPRAPHLWSHFRHQQLVLGPNVKPGPHFTSIAGFETPADFNIEQARVSQTCYDLLFLVNGLRVVAPSTEVMRIVCQVPQTSPESLKAALDEGHEMFTMDAVVSVDLSIPLIGTSHTTPVVIPGTLWAAHVKNSVSDAHTKRPAML